MQKNGPKTGQKHEIKEFHFTFLITKTFKRTPFLFFLMLYMVNRLAMFAADTQQPPASMFPFKGVKHV